MTVGPKGFSTEGPAFSLVLPFYNEEASAEETVSGLIGELARSGVVCELILVDNGSRDGTPSILKRLAEENPCAKVVTVAVNEGYGWGIICGLKQATAPNVGFMCGDGQIAPADVARVYRRLAEEGLDLCKVVRVVRHDGFKRRLISKLYNAIFPWFFPARSRDINGTPKLMRRRCYEEIAPGSRDWFIDAEIMIKAAEKAYTIGEVEVEFHPRPGGQSNVRFSTAVEFVRNMIRYRWKRR
jgi:glycosyltransferase involved in cell wall biosynthesis